MLDTLDWANTKFSKQTAEATSLTGGTLLEFNVIVLVGQYVRPTNWELVLEVIFETGDGNKIHLGKWLPVNNFFGHYLETITISNKDDLKTIVHPQPSGSIAIYIRSRMEDMSADQLRIIERLVLFNKTAVTGLDVHHRLNADDPFTPYQHLVNRRNKSAHVLDGEKNYVPDRVKQRNNLIWRDNKYVIPMTLLSPLFSVNSEICMDLIIKFNIEQDTKTYLKLLLLMEEKKLTEDRDL